RRGLLGALAGVAPARMATRTGEQLVLAVGGQNPLVAEHQQRASWLLPVAVAFLVLLAAGVLTGLAAVRAEVGAHAAPAATPTRYRAATGLTAPAALAGLGAAALRPWVGH